MGVVVDGGLWMEVWGVKDFFLLLHQTSVEVPRQQPHSSKKLRGLGTALCFTMVFIGIEILFSTSLALSRHCIFGEFVPEKVERKSN